MPIFNLTDALPSQSVASVSQPEINTGVVTNNLPPVEKPSTMKVIRKMGSSFSPSIKDALSGGSQEKKLLDDPQKNIFSQYQENDFEPFTQDELTAKWIEFLDRMADRPSLCSALSNVPEITDGNKLLLKIGNSVQEEDVRQIKPELVSWLRKELRNSGIEIITKLEKHESERVIFSDSEKLQMMMQKNPVLNEFKQKFNLDFHD